MKLLGIISLDAVNYKKLSMTLEFPYCTFKCNRGHSDPICQNYNLKNSKTYEFSNDEIIRYFQSLRLVDSVVMQGLEPLDSWDELTSFIHDFRQKYPNDHDIVIYTGYNEDEIQDKLDILKQYSNIIVKFGRYIPNDEKHYDEILGVSLESSNQYAKRL